MALKIGDQAPEFTLIDTERKPRSLKEFLGKPAILVFYPGAFTGVCSKEMCNFRDSLASFNALNAQVVGISVDSPFANMGFKEKNALTFPLLSDYSRETSRKFAGTYPSFAGLAGYEAAKRSVFVLDAKGVVRYAWISDDPAVEPPYDEVRKAAAAL
jgi:glutaredoxin-dependent peroxiredoxin